MSRRIAFITSFIFWCSSIPAPVNGGEQGPEKTGIVFDGKRARAYVTHLSADSMEGRMSCTGGYRRAADWVASKFREWGLQPAGEEGTYFQKVAIRGFDWNTGMPRLKVGDREFLLDDESFSVHPISTAGTTLQGEIVFVGYGISAPGKGLDEYGGLDVKGKIVLAFQGSPRDAPQPRGMFGPRAAAPQQQQKKDEEEWKEESTDLAKIRTAHDKGAAAILLYNPDESPGSGRRGRSSPSGGGGSFKPERKFICFYIHEQVFRSILKKDPQESPRGLKRRMDGIRREIKKKKVHSRATGTRAVLKGYDVSVRYDEKQGNNVARNVLARLEGTDPELKKEFVLVGAHLDHVGVRRGYVYNGADDNASGSAVVMELARVLAGSDFKPKRTLVFCCWTGEEEGLIGSRHFANKPCGGVSLDRVVAYFNIDMVGMGDVLGAPGALNFPEIWEVIQRGQDPQILKRIQPRTGGPGGSDHSAFIRMGIEALALMSHEGVGHQDYHQPEDDADKIDPEMLRITGQFVLQGMMNLAGESKVNLLIPRRQEIYRALRMVINNFNPDLKDSCWSRVEIKEKNPEALYDGILDQARKLLKSSSPGSPGRRSPQGTSLARGLADIRLVGDDLRLLELAIDFHGIGRVDLKGDDGPWVAGERLTDRGREAVGVLEKNEVAIRLISPGEELINDMLTASSKPFIITGKYEITHSLVEGLNRRSVLLGIDFDPGKVEDFISRLEAAKSILGERGNLFAFLTSTKGLEESRKPLYLGLIDRGWTHSEICGSRDRRSLFGGGNLGGSGRTGRSP